MINLGVYLDELSDHQIMECLAREIEKGNSQNMLKDASIFYDNIGPVKTNISAGFFNSTDIWNFEGSLIVFSLDAMEKAINYVNNFNIFYGYGWKPINTLRMIKLLSQNNIPSFSASESAANNFYRLTGMKPISINENLNNIITTLSGYSNDRTRHSESVQV